MCSSAHVSYGLIKWETFNGYLHRCNLWHPSAAQSSEQLHVFLVRYWSSGCRLGYLTMWEMQLWVLFAKMVSGVSFVGQVLLCAGRFPSMWPAWACMKKPKRCGAWPPLVCIYSICRVDSLNNLFLELRLYILKCKINSNNEFSVDSSL